MASEVLAVPEEHLQEVIDILKAGMFVMKKNISQDVAHNLGKWCEEEEQYLKRL